jgi:O-antigen/teichoic acid export membrane protein
VRFILPIILRYLSMLLQFGTFVAVSRRLPLHQVGNYYQLYGLVTTTYFATGLGLTDGLIKAVAHARAMEETNGTRALVLRAGFVSLALTIAVAAIAIIALWARLPSHLVLFTAGWWVAYGILFFCSQVLVALGHTGWGAFFYYPASSIGLFITSVPYLLFTAHPNIEGTLWWTMLGAALCALAALILMSVYLGALPSAGQAESLAPVFRLGFSICVTRVLQSSLYWIPVWAVGFWLGAAAGASMATASRLNAAAAAVMAAIRFTIRPQIVENVARGNWNRIASQSRKIATLASAAVLFVIAATIVAGHWAIGLVFGSAYASSSVLVLILLIGTLGECVGGPVDEILKMTGRADTVSATLVVAFALEVALVAAFARFGSAAAAAGQSAVFAGIYIWLLWLVWKQNRVYVGASPSWFRTLRWRRSIGSE